MIRATALVLACGALAASRPAEACHPPMCAEQIVFPNNGATIPSNATAMLVFPKVQFGMPPATLELSLEVESTGGTKVAVPTTATAESNGSFVVTFDQPLQPGTYHLTVPDYCEGSGKLDDTALQQSFEVGASAAVPTKLGVAQLKHKTLGLLDVAAHGMCEATITAAHADVALSLAAAAAPWSSLLVYETLVDGKPFYFSASLAWDLDPVGSSSDKIYVICTGDSSALPGVAEGTRKVTFRATLAGTSTTLESDPLSLELLCGGIGGDDMPGPDGGLLPPSGDAPPVADGAGINPAAPTRSGCSCELGGGGAPRDATLLPLFLLALLWLRNSR